MAELTPLYMDISGVYSGDELGLPYRDIMAGGVVGSGDLAVTQHAGGANLSVDVAAGAAWVLGSTDPVHQPCYRVINDATVNKGITPDPSNPRIVLIVAQITDATFAGATRQWAITAIHGTPAATPVAPILPASALLLATVTVPAAAASIVTANITDNRRWAIPGGSSSSMAAGPPTTPRHNELWEARDVDANGTRWTFRYNALSSSAYKWEFLGGSTAHSRVNAFESRANAAYGDLATVGPQFTIPRAGDWLIRYGALGNITGTGQNAQMTVYGGAARLAASEVDIGTGVFSNGSAEEVLAAVASGTVLAAKYAATGGSTAQFSQRYLSVTPQRIA